MKASTILTSLLFSLIISLTTTSNAQGRSEYNSDADPSDIRIKVVEITSPTCNGKEDGSATIEVVGGEAPYTYNWNTFPNQYGKTATNLSSGIYFIYVKDAQGNSSFRSVHVEEPNTSLLAEKKDIDINELELTASVKGASSYNYEVNTNVSENDKIGDLPVGIHKVKITDNKNCVMVQYIQVFEVSESDQKKAITSTASYSNKNGKKILVSNLIPVNDKDPEKNNYSIQLEKN